MFQTVNSMIWEPKSGKIKLFDSSDGSYTCFCRHSLGCGKIDLIYGTQDIYVYFLYIICRIHLRRFLMSKNLNKGQNGIWVFDSVGILTKVFYTVLSKSKKVWFYIIQDWKNQRFVEKMRTNFDPGYNLKLPFPIT